MTPEYSSGKPGDEPAPRGHGRTWVPAIASLAAIALGAVATWMVIRSGGGAVEETARKHVANTALVERKTLRETITSPGSLSYGASSRLAAGRAGTITRLPREGGKVKPGGVLHSIDNQPVVLLRGRLPAWRAFESGMSDGPDVRQLERKVTVNLPGGKATTGTIAEVGAPRQREDGDDKKIIVPVTITLDRPAAAGSLQEVSVSIDFPTASRKDVLAVPVAALIALPDGGYGVEVVRDAVTTRTVPVKAGLFAGGSVEVTGDGLEAGQKVVVPTL